MAYIPRQMQPRIRSISRARFHLTHKDIFICCGRFPWKAWVRLPVQSCVAALKAMAEPTRLRLLVLLALGRAQRQGPHGHPGAEPAAHQPASEAAGRGRPGRARAGGQLGIFPARPRAARAARWRAWCSRPWTATMPLLARDRRRAEALQRGAREGSAGLFPGPRRRVGPHPRPARGRGARGGRRCPRRWAPARSICSSTSAPERDACSSCSATAIGAASAST